MNAHRWAPICVNEATVWVSADGQVIDGFRKPGSYHEAERRAADLGGRLSTPVELDLRWFHAGLTPRSF